MANPQQHPPDSQISDSQISEEDLCPICHLLLHNPVTTSCNHNLCASCMSHWSRVSCSTTTSMTILPPPSPSTSEDGFEEQGVACPMCRRVGGWIVNEGLGRELRGRYPGLWEGREVEEREVGGGGYGDGDAGGLGVEEVVQVCVGNWHWGGDGGEEQDGNVHEWEFFVRVGREDVVEEVQMLLHPTFRPNLVFRKQPPYSIRRKGWGHFTITAYIILKPGWSWVSEDAEVVPFRRDTAKSKLPLDWELDFTGHGGRGSMGRFRIGVRRERGVEERREGEENERRDVDGEWQVEWVDDDEEGAS